jgi:hypothetical protein
MVSAPPRKVGAAGKTIVRDFQRDELRAFATTPAIQSILYVVRPTVYVGFVYVL